MNPTHSFLWFVACLIFLSFHFFKVSNCEAYGANVVLHGEHILEAAEHAAEHFEEARGMTYINGYDHPDVYVGLTEPCCPTHCPFPTVPQQLLYNSVLHPPHCCRQALR